MYSVIDKVALNSAPVNAPVNPDTVFCFCLCVATEKSPQPFTHSGPFHSRPLSSSCAFQGLKRGLGRVRAVGQCVFLTHRFQELAEHVQRSKIHHEKERRLRLPVFLRQRMLQPDPGPSCWTAQCVRV